MMDSLKRYWKSVPAAVRKPLVLIVGSFLVILGLILLPLPGPGWLVIFLGFALLASEFVFAERIRDWLVDNLKLIIDKLKVVWKKLLKKAK